MNSFYIEGIIFIVFSLSVSLIFLTEPWYKIIFIFEQTAHYYSFNDPHVFPPLFNGRIFIKVFVFRFAHGPSGSPLIAHTDIVVSFCQQILAYIPLVDPLMSTSYPTIAHSLSSFDPPSSYFHPRFSFCLPRPHPSVLPLPNPPRHSLSSPIFHPFPTHISIFPIFPLHHFI